MENHKVKENLERMKAKAELFLKQNTKVFIKTFSKDFYFCEILVVGENYLFVYNFTGKRKGEKDRLLWLDILDIEEYMEEE